MKPANIALTRDGNVKVLDFGLAKTVEANGGSSPDVTNSPTLATPAMLTGVGVILGTAAYMAPEQAIGKSVDRRADVWAFGVLVMEMLSGRRVFAGETVSDVLSAYLAFRSIKQGRQSIAGTRHANMDFQSLRSRVLPCDARR